MQLHFSSLARSAGEVARSARGGTWSVCRLPPPPLRGTSPAPKRGGGKRTADQVSVEAIELQVYGAPSARNALLTASLPHCEPSFSALSAAPREICSLQRLGALASWRFLFRHALI